MPEKIDLLVDSVQMKMYQIEVDRERKRYLLEREIRPPRPLPPPVIEMVERPMGKSSHGEPTLAAVRQYYVNEGYTVWVSGSDGKREDRFILMSYPGLRRKKGKSMHPAYKQMVDIFGEGRLEDLNTAGDREKREFSGASGGGDPDLFVFWGDRKKEGFFVEAKRPKEPLLPHQKICFRLIEQHLPTKVVIARLHETKSDIRSSENPRRRDS